MAPLWLGIFFAVAALKRRDRPKASRVLQVADRGTFDFLAEPDRSPSMRTNVTRCLLSCVPLLVVLSACGGQDAKPRQQSGPIGTGGNTNTNVPDATVPNFTD